jgi:SAM-dependent methyltransferase
VALSEGGVAAGEEGVMVSWSKSRTPPTARGATSSGTCGGSPGPGKGLSDRGRARLFERATFTHPIREAALMVVPRVSLGYVWEFLRDGETPLRVLNDAAVRAFMSFLEGPGTIYELGGAGDYYKAFAAPGQSFVVSNVDDSGDVVIDAASIAMADASVDAFFSIFALEHIYDFQAVVAEVDRCLKPGGRLLLAVPFLYYEHGEPDFFRFTRGALDTLLSRFKIVKAASFGNRGLLIGQLMHEKRVLGSRRSWATRTLLRLCAAPVVLGGLLGDQHGPVYALGHLYLCEKP